MNVKDTMNTPNLKILTIARCTQCPHYLTAKWIGSQFCPLTQKRAETPDHLFRQCPLPDKQQEPDDHEI